MKKRARFMEPATLVEKKERRQKRSKKHPDRLLEEKSVLNKKGKEESIHSEGRG